MIIIFLFSPEIPRRFTRPSGMCGKNQNVGGGDSVELSPKCHTICEVLPDNNTDAVGSGTILY